MCGAAEIAVRHKPVGADLSGKKPVQPTHFQRLKHRLRSLRRLVSSYRCCAFRETADLLERGLPAKLTMRSVRYNRGANFAGKPRSNRTYVRPKTQRRPRSRGSGPVREGVGLANTSSAPETPPSRASLAPTEFTSDQKPSTDQNPVGADLSAKVSVWPIHLQRLKLRLRGQASLQHLAAANITPHAVRVGADEPVRGCDAVWLTPPLAAFRSSSVPDYVFAAGFARDVRTLITRRNLMPSPSRFR